MSINTSPKSPKSILERTIEKLTQDLSISNTRTKSPSTTSSLTPTSTPTPSPPLPTLESIPLRSQPVYIDSSTKPTVYSRLQTEFKSNIFIDTSTPEDTVYEQKSNSLTDERDPSQAPEKIFEFFEELGSGTSGHVVKMKHKPSGRICAVKIMRRTGYEEENKRIYMDLQVLLECKCDQIVRCYGYFIEETEVWICMELMTTCFDKLMIKRDRKALSEKVIGVIAVSILKALRYLKEYHRVIHRDVKPSNILINDEGQVKLCDFGISGRLVNSLAKTRAAGCLRYLAPERVDPSIKGYDVRSDVWSLGMTLVELATGKCPHSECKSDFEVLNQIVYKDPPNLHENSYFSSECKSFISDCLTKNVKFRPKYKQLIQHEFIVKHMNSKINLKEL